MTICTNNETVQRLVRLATEALAHQRHQVNTQVHPLDGGKIDNNCHIFWHTLLKQVYALMGQ